MRASKKPAALELRETAFRAGVGALGDVELLALLLSPRGGDARSLAARLLDEAGGLAGVARWGALDTMDATGVGPAAATRLAAALELGRRALAELTQVQREIVGSFDAVERWARPRLTWLEHEEVWLLGLDGRNGLRIARRVAQGGAHGCALSPRDVLAPAVRDGSSAIVLCHNHPSGDPTPSPEDLAMTQALARACEVVGIPLLDHVVVARSGARSVFELFEDR